MYCIRNFLEVHRLLHDLREDVGGFSDGIGHIVGLVGWRRIAEIADGVNSREKREDGSERSSGVFVVVAIRLANGVEWGAKFAPPAVLHGFLDVGEDLEGHMGFCVERIVDIDACCCGSKMLHVRCDGLSKIKLEVDESVKVRQNVAVVWVDGAGDGGFH